MTTPPLTIKLSDLAWRAILHESTHSGRSIEELMNFAALYYVTAIEDGRLARPTIAAQQPNQRTSPQHGIGRAQTRTGDRARAKRIGH